MLGLPMSASKPCMTTFTLDVQRPDTIKTVSGLFLVQPIERTFTSNYRSGNHRPRPKLRGQSQHECRSGSAPRYRVESYPYGQRSSNQSVRHPGSKSHRKLLDTTPREEAAEYQSQHPRASTRQPLPTDSKSQPRRGRAPRQREAASTQPSSCL